MARPPQVLLVYPEFPPSYWGFQYALELVGMIPALRVGRSVHVLPVLAVIILVVRLVSERIVL